MNLADELRHKMRKAFGSSMALPVEEEDDKKEEVKQKPKSKTPWIIEEEDISDEEVVDDPDDPPVEIIEEKQNNNVKESALATDHVVTKPAVQPKTLATDSPKPAAPSQPSPNTNSKKKVNHVELRKEAEAFGRAFYSHKVHRCLLSDVDRIDGTDSCSKGNPATLNKDSAKLHYVIHYKQRGVWDKICPGPETREEFKVACYICNACNKKFKNYLNKNEYPGWGTFICHIASEHGKLYDAMKEDPLVDMTEAIEFLRRVDKRFADQIDEERDYLPEDEKFVTIEESVFWRSHLQAMKQREAESSSIQPSKSPSPKPDPTRTTTPVTKAGQPRKFSCPHCAKLSQNTDRAALRLHLFTHYKDKWIGQVNSLPGAGVELELGCDEPGCNRRVTGASVEGVKNSMICHLAIHHGQLRKMLEKDQSLDQDFIKDLYTDRPSNSGPRGRPITIDYQHPKRPTNPTPRPKKQPAVKKKKAKSLLSDDSSMSDSDDDSSLNGSIVKPGATNTEYVRKRKKIRLTFSDLEESDDGEDGNWEMKKKKKSAKAAQSSGDNINVTPRSLPRRSAASRAKVAWAEEDDDEDLSGDE